MTTEEKAKAYDEALEQAKKELKTCGSLDCDAARQIFRFFPELRESEDERIRKEISNLYSDIDDCITELLKARTDKNVEAEGKALFKMEGLMVATLQDLSCIEAYLEKQKDASKAIEAVERIDKYIDEHVANAHDMKDSNPDKKYYRGWDDALGKMAGILQDVYSGEKQKPIKMEVYEAGKSTTICGQDYKCKKDYKEGNCRYIKDAIYHCGRDGYLTDQNGVSWSCTPEWFKEYIQSNAEWAEEEKNLFVSGQFLQCKLSFDGFKEGEHYWLEYVDDDIYVGRSDNILSQKFHITPRQLYTLFSQQLEEVQGPPQGEKQVSLNYEPPFNENPSDREIIEALIHHLNEQDGFLTAINCVSTKAILSWLKKQKEQKPTEWNEEDDQLIGFIFDLLNSLVWRKEWAMDKKECLERLKSFRSRPKSSDNWKPSEEQMIALYNMIPFVKSEGVPSEAVKPLESLYEDLKKL